MRIDASGFLIEYQMSIRAMKLRLRVVEIPTYEDDRIAGESKAKSILTGFNFLKFLVKEIMKDNRF